VRLGVVEGNRNAWSLYQSHGFVPTGEREPLVSNPTRDVVYLEFSLR
jgi:ribosomal protein S18 acetylase RimI-like enzyme